MLQVQCSTFEHEVLSLRCANALDFNFFSTYYNETPPTSEVDGKIDSLIRVLHQITSNVHAHV